MNPVYQTERCTVYQGDCTKIMPKLDADTVDLILTDPPYGIGEAAGKNKSRGHLAIAKDFGNLDWDNQSPAKDAFVMMSRFGAHEIIWGGNFFAKWLGNSSCWLVWDKVNYSNDFADCELAWTDLPCAVRKITWQWNGMLQQDMKYKEKRYHPTQKPVPVMRWCLSFVPNAKCVLDPYAGSGSTGVACIREGMQCILIEREPQYIDIIIKRLKIEEEQQLLF